MLSFLLYTGCRISEALAVSVSDIEDRGNLKVVVIRGKGDKIRTLPLHPKLLKNLLELISLRQKGQGDYLFTRVKGEGAEDEPMRRQSVNEVEKFKKDGTLTMADQAIIHAWIREVAFHGPESIRGEYKWADHELENDWEGYRSSSFSQQRRIIYRIEDKLIKILIARITPKHDYRKEGEKP